MVNVDTVKVCLQVLNEGMNLRPINKTFITLIPKTSKPKKMDEFRPIILCNVVYKTVAKVIINRMKSVLGSIISQSQSAFIPGRLITDNVVIGFECIHALNNRRSGKTGIAALKLDMSKAYDRVEWEFIRMLLVKMNFPNKWVNLILKCIEILSNQVLINRVPQREILPKRGLRQGDPLSPYLFIICAEGLSALLKREELNSNISGIKINNHYPTITHLFFANDNLIFFKASKKEGDNIKKVLQTYEQVLGQKINLEKSVVMVSKNISQTHAEE